MASLQVPGLQKSKIIAEEIGVIDCTNLLHVRLAFAASLVGYTATLTTSALEHSSSHLCPWILHQPVHGKTSAVFFSLSVRMKRDLIFPFADCCGLHGSSRFATRFSSKQTVLLIRFRDPRRRSRCCISLILICINGVRASGPLLGSCEHVMRRTTDSVSFFTLKAVRLKQDGVLRLNAKNDRVIVAIQVVAGFTVSRIHTPPALSRFALPFMALEDGDSSKTLMW